MCDSASLPQAGRGRAPCALGPPGHDGTAEVSIYLASTHHGKGVGSTMLSEAIRMAPTLELESLLGFVFSHNQPSLSLLRKHGFIEWGRLPGIARMGERRYSVSILGLKLTSG